MADALEPLGRSTDTESDRLRIVEDKLLIMRGNAHELIARSYRVGPDVSAFPDPPTFKANTRPEVAPFTMAYADLTFAFGLARLGKGNQAGQLRATARQVLGSTDPVHDLLCDAYEYRIEQVIRNTTHTGPLATELLDRIERLDPKRRYSVDSLRQQSHLLEPYENVDVAIRLTKDDVERGLLMLQDSRDETRLFHEVETFLTQEAALDSDPVTRAHRLASVLPVVARLGETLSLQVLDRSLAVIESLAGSRVDLESLGAGARLLERSLVVGAQHKQVDRVRAFLPWFVRLFEAHLKHERGTVRELDRVVALCFVGLRKLGLNDDIKALLHGLSGMILKGQVLDVVRVRTGHCWPGTVQTLVHLAAGWLYLGQVEASMPILDTARDLLFFETLPYFLKTPLACAYAAALGEAPIELSLGRFGELFPRIGRIWDTLESRYYFSRYQLRLIETAVLAMVNEDRLGH